MNLSMFSNRFGGVRFGLAIALVAVVIGCDDRDTDAHKETPSPAQASSADALPAGLVVPEAPAGARDVVALKKGAKAGDEVVVRGRVGGSVSPFVDGRASLQLIDTSLKACGEGTAMDECKTPWDYCCDEPKEVAAHSASVQVVGADGKPLRVGLQGVGGLKPLSVVTVKGTVAKAPDSGLVVNATAIHVGK